MPDRDVCPIHIETLSAFYAANRTRNCTGQSTRPTAGNRIQLALPTCKRRSRGTLMRPHTRRINDADRLLDSRPYTMSINMPQMVGLNQFIRIRHRIQDCHDDIDILRFTVHLSQRTFEALVLRMSLSPASNELHVGSIASRNLCIKSSDHEHNDIQRH